MLAPLQSVSHLAINRKHQSFNKSPVRFLYPMPPKSDNTGNRIPLAKVGSIRTKGSHVIDDVRAACVCRFNRRTERLGRQD